jgi:hypothetical protein
LHREPTQLLAEALGRGHDHAAQLHERLAADVDGAATGEQQQPQRLAVLSRARQRQALAAPTRASVLVPVRLDADHVVQLVCNRPDRSSGFVRRVR